MSEAFCMPLLPMELECLLYCTWLHNCSLDPLLVCCYILACWLLGGGLDHFSLFLIYIYTYIYIYIYIYSTAVHLIIPFCVHFMSLIKCGMLCHLSSWIFAGVYSLPWWVVLFMASGITLPDIFFMIITGGFYRWALQIHLVVRMFYVLQIYYCLVCCSLCTRFHNSPISFELAKVAMLCFPFHFDLMWAIK